MPLRDEWQLRPHYACPPQKRYAEAVRRGRGHGAPALYSALEFSRPLHASRWASLALHRVNSGKRGAEGMRVRMWRSTYGDAHASTYLWSMRKDGRTVRCSLIRALNGPRTLMRFRALALLILLGCSSHSERVVYVSLPKAPGVDQGQLVYRYGQPVGVVRAVQTVGDSVHLRVAITRIDAPVSRTDRVQLVVSPLWEQRLELRDGPTPGTRAQSGDTLASLPSIRRDTITAAAVESLPSLYRTAKRVRDRLKRSSP